MSFDMLILGTYNVCHTWTTMQLEGSIMKEASVVLKSSYNKQFEALSCPVLSCPVLS
jgi:hypothetical protein